jgi:single-strand DNA-binding protein
MFSSTRFMFARATAATSVPKRDFTRVTVMGRVGNEPELRNFDGGAKMISFSLAVDRKSSNSMTSAEQRKKNTMWFRVFFFETGSALTKVVDEKVTKGALVLIDGELTQRQFKGKTGFDNNVTDIHIGNGKWSTSDARGCICARNFVSVFFCFFFPQLTSCQFRPRAYSCHSKHIQGQRCRQGCRR